MHEDKLMDHVFHFVGSLVAELFSKHYYYTTYFKSKEKKECLYTVKSSVNKVAKE